ncbi:MAG TPA: hypothetical protein VFW50_43230 [Streptosporangiaceae bacterium]|nr:hypothetical protein [Streptosporangiaceae bacterium]
MRIVRWLGVVLWAGSWFLMYLEITRWRHVKPSLAFNSDPDPVTGLRPHPGLPLISVYVASVAAPLAVVASLLSRRRLRS